MRSNSDPVQSVPSRLGPPEPTRGLRPLARLSFDDRRRIIVDRAAHLFEARGFDATSMQDIANDVGIAKGAIYHYFPSKQDVLFAVHNAFVDEMFDKAQAFLAGDPDPIEQLDFFVSDIIRTCAEYQPYVKVFFQELGTLRAEQLAEIKAKRDAYEQLVEDAVALGVEGGRLSIPTSPRIAALFMFGACNWTYQWMQPHGPLSPVDLALAFRELLLHGLGLKGAAVAEAGDERPG